MIQYEKLSVKPLKSLWNRLKLMGNFEELHGIILSHYTEATRYYHHIQHIMRGLTELDLVKSMVSHYDLMEYARWYHDVIYDVNASDNEWKSAELACEHATKYGLTDNSLIIIRNCIMATRHHDIPKTPEEKVICDVDLSIFGQDPSEFHQYEKDIRKEYSHISAHQFNRGRKVILEYFLNKDSIYHTDYFRDKYEKKARENLSNALLKL